MRLGSGVVSIELHCGDVLWTNFDPVNFCPFDTFLKNTLSQINRKLNSKLLDNPYKHCLSTGKKVSISIQTSLLNAVSLPLNVSIPFPLRRLESAASYQIALKYLLCG